MDKKGILLRVSHGTCPSFKKMDISTVLNPIRREKLVDFVAIHPQLCADDGNEFLKALMTDKEINKLFVAGCDLQMQQKMFRDASDDAGFDARNHATADIRNMTTEEAVDATKRLIEQNSKEAKDG
ncbi:MAG: heterodisulfide reductase subunit A-like protein [Candidatus Thermoplasmatota archaeon]|nr:heterodisulfide reductase subunit A-like protein [Candidatus Thermoplasmatota archaeon]